MSWPTSTVLLRLTVRAGRGCRTSAWEIIRTIGRRTKVVESNLHNLGLGLTNSIGQARLVQGLCEPHAKYSNRVKKE